ncbi:MAG: 3-oxoacyl-[acyl-carrier-protein] reductase [bacterium]
MDLKGKVAVVTGAARGIGREIALTLAKQGCDVAVCDIDLDGASRTSDDISALGVKSVALKANVSDPRDVEAMIERVMDAFSHIDILVNNAGITRDALMIRMKDEAWDAVIDVNLKGTFNCTRAVSKIMMRQRSGKIVNIASVIGLIGNVGQANYAASKAGVIALTKTAARELAPRGINVNAVAPGFIDTEMTRALPQAERDKILSRVPLGRLGQPEDVARAVAFLVSEDADYITGQVLTVDGGMVMS